MFDSAPSQAAGLDLAHFRYDTTEYFVSGTASGQPYTSMHVSGAAHAVEFTAAYVMDAGHAAIEILTTSPQPFAAFNAERYSRLAIADGQQNEIIA